MKLRDAAALSGSALVKAPTKTLLTILGLGVGVAAILTVLTLGDAGQTRVEAEIARLGVDKVWITAAADSDRALTARDSLAVAAAVDAPACASAVTIAPVIMGDEAAVGQIVGYDEQFAAVHGPVLTAGRLFLPQEHAQGAAVALVDTAMDEALGGTLGMRLQVGARTVRVVGVMQRAAGQTMGGVAGTVVLPLQTHMDTFAGDVAELTVSVPSGRQAGAIGDAASALLNARGGAFTATSLEEEIDAAQAVIRIFVMVLSCVAAVCMLTGAIGVMNILLVSVRERRREIGLIKAIGGTSGQVALLFLLEAAGYALLGGTAGLALGWLLVHTFGSWIGLAAGVAVDKAALILLVSAALGVFFGVVPALRAAGMQPVDALKEE